jgi:hypothetical protein
LKSSPWTSSGSIGIPQSKEHLVEGITSGESHQAVLQGRNGNSLGRSQTL